MIKCPHCGRKIPYDANVCPYCGRSIKQFQQKDLLDDEISVEMPEIQQDDDVVNPPSPLKNDKKKIALVSMYSGNKKTVKRFVFMTM